MTKTAKELNKNDLNLQVENPEWKIREAISFISS